MAPHRVDEAIALIAQHQWGTCGDRQAQQAGASRMFIARRLSQGRLVRLGPGALGFPDWPPSFERSLWVSLHGAVSGAIVGGWSGGTVYGFLGFPPSRLELLVPHGRTHVHATAVVRQTRRFPEVVRFNGFPMASRERVLCDVVRFGETRMRRALDEELHKRNVTLHGFERAVDAVAVPGSPHAGTLRRILAAVDDSEPVPRSLLERELRAIMAGIPGIRLRLEAQIGDRAELTHLADVVVEEPRKLIVEGDGRTYHERRAQMALDRRRDRRAAANGYATFRYLYDEVVHDRAGTRDEIVAYLFPATGRLGHAAGGD